MVDENLSSFDKHYNNIPKLWRLKRLYKIDKR